jgi:hypothetical protein
MREAIKTRASLWHSNTSKTQFEDALPALIKSDGEQALKKTAKGDEVHAVFASGGDLAKTCAYAYALKFDALESSKLRTVHIINDVVVAIIVNRDHHENNFIKDAGGKTTHIYELDPEGFENTIGSEYIKTSDKGPATIISAEHLNGQQAINSAMTNSVQILFVNGNENIERLNELDKQLYQQYNSGVSKEESEGFELNFIKDGIDSGLFVHYNAEKNIQPIDFSPKTNDREEGQESWSSRVTQGAAAEQEPSR